MKTRRTKAMKIKINEINETTKTGINEIKTKTTRAERRVNPKIRTLIIIFIIKESREKRASIRK